MPYAPLQSQTDTITVNGRRSGTALGSVTTSQAYNAFGELASDASSAGYANTYTRDRLGRITQKVETIGGTTTTYGYAYDLAGRLAQVSVNGVVARSYAYDANGNRLSVTDAATGTTSGTYDAQDRLLSYGAATFTYNAAGDLTSKTDPSGTTTYAYDALGNLIQVDLPDGRVVTYVIDGQTRRVGKRVNDSLVQGFLYQDQLEPVAELDGSGAVVARFVYGSRPNAPDYMVKGGVTYRILADHLGSPRLVVDASTGAVAQRIDYDEFGRVLLDTNPGFQPFGFAGGIDDRDIALVRFGARDYDAETGRWTAKDPIGFAGEDENLYRYARTTPVDLSDTSGQCPWCVAAGTGALGGAATDLVLQLLLNGGNLDCVDWADVGQAALTGAALSAFGPTGALLGRGGTRAAQFGYSKSAGLANRGAFRFGWSGPRNGRDVLSLRIGKAHRDLPFVPGVPSGANPVRDGAFSGFFAGAGTAAASDDCACQ